MTLASEDPGFARPIGVVVNGRPQRRLVSPRTHLIDFLREDLGLTGSHLGCEHGVCGACTVRLDGDVPCVAASCSRCRPMAARSRRSRA